MKRAVPAALLLLGGVAPTAVIAQAGQTAPPAPAAPPTPVAPPAPAAAPVVDPANLAVARQLIGLMRIDETLDRMYVQLAPLFAQSVIGVMSGDPSTKPALDLLMTKGTGGRDRLVAILSQEFLASIKKQYPALKERTAVEYAAAFTGDELRQLAAFYGSGVGAKALKLMPELQQKMAVAGRELGQAAGAEAGRKAFERAQREMLPATTKPTA